MFNFFLGLMFGGFIGTMAMAMCAASGKKAMCEGCQALAELDKEAKE